MKKFLIVLSVTAFASSAQASDCDKYVSCVCDWAKEVGAKMGDSSSQDTQCKAIKQVYQSAGPELQSACKDAMSMMKDILKQQSDLMSISVPASCK